MAATIRDLVQTISYCGIDYFLETNNNDHLTPMSDRNLKKKNLVNFVCESLFVTNQFDGTERSQGVLKLFMKFFPANNESVAGSKTGIFIRFSG